MAEQKKLFITTHDEETRDKLLDIGFTMVEDANGRYVFLNDKTMTFDKDGKVYYTDRLFI